MIYTIFKSRFLPLCLKDMSETQQDATIESAPYNAVTLPVTPVLTRKERRVLKGKALLMTDPNDGTIVGMEDTRLRSHCECMAKLHKMQARRAERPPDKAQRSAIRKFEDSWCHLVYLQAKGALSPAGEESLRWVVEHTEVETGHL